MNDIIEKYKEHLDKLNEISIPNIEQQAEKKLIVTEMEELKKRKQELLDMQNLEQKGGIVEPYNNVNNINTIYTNNQNPLYLNPNQNLNSNPLYLPKQLFPQYKSINEEKNKEKNKESKLSFYITIQLDLFPGKSPTTMQKAEVKCQSSFERIRKSWTEIFGFQYRPAPVYYANNWKTKKNINKKSNNKTKRATDAPNKNIDADEKEADEKKDADEKEEDEKKDADEKKP